MKHKITEEQLRQMIRQEIISFDYFKKKETFPLQSVFISMGIGPNLEEVFDVLIELRGNVKTGSPWQKGLSILIGRLRSFQETIEKLEKKLGKIKLEKK